MPSEGLLIGLGCWWWGLEGAEGGLDFGAVCRERLGGVGEGRETNLSSSREEGLEGFKIALGIVARAVRAEGGRNDTVALIGGRGGVSRTGADGLDGFGGAFAEIGVSSPIGGSVNRGDLVARGPEVGPAGDDSLGLSDGGEIGDGLIERSFVGGGGGRRMVGDDSDNSLGRLEVLVSIGVEEGFKFVEGLLESTP